MTIKVGDSVSNGHVWGEVLATDGGLAWCKMEKSVGVGHEHLTFPFSVLRVTQERPEPRTNRSERG